jgi:tetratricopeptide (TPR) repeat protein
LAKKANNERGIARAQYTRAQVFREQGKHKLAQRTMSHALELSTPIYGANSPFLLWSRADYALMLAKGGDPKAGLEDIERTIALLQTTTGAISQESSYARAMRGLVRFELRDYKGALEDQQFVLSDADPTQEYNIRARRYMADTLVKLGREQDALREYCYAMKLLGAEALKNNRNAKRFRIEVENGLTSLAPATCKN